MELPLNCTDVDHPWQWEEARWRSIVNREMKKRQSMVTRNDTPVVTVPGA